MSDSPLITRLQGATNRFLRRSSAVSAASSTTTNASADTDESTAATTAVPPSRPANKRQSSFPKLIRRFSRPAAAPAQLDKPLPHHPPTAVETDAVSKLRDHQRQQQHQQQQQSDAAAVAPDATEAKPIGIVATSDSAPNIVLQAPSPDHPAAPNNLPPPTPTSLSPPTPRNRPLLHRTLSSQARAVSPAKPSPVAAPAVSLPPVKPVDDTSATSQSLATSRPPQKMSRRRIWVRRPGASATLVRISEDDYVDEVRDMIITKYQNSLGRTFDAPDVTLRIVPRERSHPERTLGPEEEMCKTLDAYFPGGQTVDEALLIDVPVKRTPRPSPRVTAHANQYFEDQRPAEDDNEYFPIMPATSPGHAHSINSQGSRHSYGSAGQQQPHSIAVLSTGALPPLPSPGANPRARSSRNRPYMGRQHTSSPTILTTATAKPNPATFPARPTRQRQNSGSEHTGRAGASATAKLTPPLPSDVPMAPNSAVKPTSTPPAQASRMKSRKKQISRPNGASVLHEADSVDAAAARVNNPYAGLLDNSVPPINVLIVEDNIINLKLLEQLARRLKVRWTTAMNGREAVNKWRAGGFHLVLMDIQLPIMNGLEATKEIRRLERVNGIGVFAKADGENGIGRSNSTDSDEMATNGDKAIEHVDSETEKEDRLDDGGVFKSPVIIVALTASSLQSDRHEALAAGCNDFLTKPVNFVWFERKVMEWGCMQALIDFDGWRQWKQRAAEEEKRQEQHDSTLTAAERDKKKAKEAKRRALLEKMGQKSG